MIASGALPHKGFDAEFARNTQTMLDEGRKTFLYDTFGSETFWGDGLQLGTDNLSLSSVPITPDF